MQRTVLLSLALLLLCPLSVLADQDGGSGNAAGGAAPATPPAPAISEADAAQYIKDLRAQLGKQADPDIKAAIKKLVEIWKSKDVTEETKKAVPEILERYAKDDKTVVAIAIEAIDALGELGPAAGAGPALAILEKSLKAKEPSLDIYGASLRALKKLADTKPKTLKTLMDLLDYKLDDVVGKSADALGGYKGAPGKVRKELLEELIKKTEGVYSQAQDPKNATQVRKWNFIERGVMNSINALSGQKFKDPTEARKWYNEHKKDKMWEQ